MATIPMATIPIGFKIFLIQIVKLSFSSLALRTARVLFGNFIYTLKTGLETGVLGLGRKKLETFTIFWVKSLATVSAPVILLH
jgi:hypothetical protein